MDKFLSELRMLYEQKASLPGVVEHIINQQQAILLKLMQREELEKQAIDGFIVKIKQLETYKEFNVSKEEFYKILKEKNVEENFANMFHNEITNILNNLGRLKILFESQIKTKNLGNLKLEKEIYENVSADLNAIESSKLKIKEYFNDINKLTYKKKYVKSGQIISKLIKNVLFRVEINGIENIPKRGPCILAPHHYDAMFDGVLLSAVINRDLFFLATVEGFVAVPLYGKFLINIGCIPLKRDDSKFNARLPNAISQEKIDSFPVSNIASIKKMLIHLRNGDVLVIFPEGEAKTNGPTYERPNNEDFLPPQEGFVSIAFLAKRAYNKDVPIIPIGIKYGKGIFRTAIINIGAPIYLSNDLQNMNKQELNKAIAEYMAQIFAQIKGLST